MQAAVIVAIYEWETRVGSLDSEATALPPHSVPRSGVHDADGSGVDRKLVGSSKNSLNYKIFKKEFYLITWSAFSAVLCASDSGQLRGGA